MSKSKGTRYSEGQIIRILRAIESGSSLANVIQKYEVAENAVSGATARIEGWIAAIDW